MCVPWTSENLSVGNGDASDMKECSGSAVLEMKRLQMWDGIEMLC